MKLNGSTILALVIIFLMSSTVRVFAQSQSDPTGDCLSLAGTAVSCEPSIDIVSSDVSMSNGAYTGTITFAGNVPSNSTTHLEWDIAIDADRNLNTSSVCAYDECSTTVSNLIFNGIGVDFLIGYNLWNNPCDNGAYSSATGKPCTFIFANWYNSYPLHPARVSGNTIQFSWKPTDVMGTGLGAFGPSFDFVILAGVFSGSGDTFGQLQSFDKAPNVGYYEFQAGKVTCISCTAVPELSAAPIVAFMALGMSFNLSKYHKKLF